MSGNEQALIGQQSDGKIEPSSGDFTDPAVLSGNQWGMSLDDPMSNGYSMFAIPAYGDPQLIKTTTNNNAELADPTAAYYTVKADTTIQPGAYSGSVLYTAVGNL
jgi:hypothetical protein